MKMLKKKERIEFTPMNTSVGNIFCFAWKFYGVDVFLHNNLANGIILLKWIRVTISVIGY